MSHQSPAKRFRAQESEESNFCRLFNQVLRHVREKEKSVTDDDIELGKQKIIASFRNEPPGQGGNFLTLDLLNNVDIAYAYLCRYGPLGAGLVRCRTLDAIESCDEFIGRLTRLENGEVNVVSLGGGPGNCIIGFCSALHEHVRYRNLNLFVADSVNRWKSCLSVVEFLVREEDFGNVSELFRMNNVSTSFIWVHLPGDSEKDIKYFRALQKADIIIMAKLLSIVPEAQQLLLMKRTIEGMKPGAILVFVDSPVEEDFFPGLNIIYRSESPYYSFPEVNVSNCHEVAPGSKGKIVVAYKNSCEENKAYQMIKSGNNKPETI